MLQKITKAFLVSILLIVLIYILFVQTEKYESYTTVSVKDLSQKQEVNLGAMILGQSTEVVKDSNVLQIYIRSYDMYRHLDKIFHLTQYYSSDRIDPMKRLYKYSFSDSMKLNKENLLKRYNEDLSVSFDTLSQTMTIAFSHVDPKTSEKILKEIIRYSDEVINRITRESAKVSLDFVSKLVEENRKKFIKSIEKLIAYQNKHKTFDPELDVKRITTILAELEADLAKKQVEYDSKKNTGWNLNSMEMKTLRAAIRNTKRLIERLRRKLSGKNTNDELNVNVFKFKLLQSDMEFMREIYRQTLASREKLKIEVSQNARHLVVIVSPFVPDEYKYPQKFREILILLVAFLLIYVFLRSVVTILLEHKD